MSYLAVCMQPIYYDGEEKINRSAASLLSKFFPKIAVNLTGIEF